MSDRSQPKEKDVISLAEHVVEHENSTQYGLMASSYLAERERRVKLESVLAEALGLTQQALLLPSPGVAFEYRARVFGYRARALLKKCNPECDICGSSDLTLNDADECGHCAMAEDEQRMMDRDKGDS